MSWTTAPYMLLIVPINSVRGSPLSVWDAPEAEQSESSTDAIQLDKQNLIEVDSHEKWQLQYFVVLEHA